MKISAEQLTIREAQERDIPALAAIYAADEVGSHGDTTDPEALADYSRAFDAIAASPNESLYVAELEGEIVGTFQTVILNKLVGRGSVSMAMEAVQTRSDMRGQGIGAIMVDYCIDKAKKAGYWHGAARLERGPAGRASLLRAAWLREATFRLQNEAEITL